MKGFKKSWTPVHKWAGLIFGVILTIICATGAVLSFEKELLPWSIREIYFHKKTDGKTIKMEDLVKRLEQDASVKSIVYPADPARNWVVTFANAPEKEVYVNPYTGQIVGTFTYKGSFFSVVREIHRFLLMGKAGRLITGTSSLVFIILLLSGVILRIPASLKRIPALFRFDWKGNTFRKTFNLHVVLGLYAFLFLLVMSATGPFWSFEWYNRGLSALFGIPATTSKRSSQPPAEEGVKTLSPSEFSLIEDKLSSFSAVQSDWKEIRVILPASSENNFTFAVIPTKQIHGRQSDTYTWQLTTGALVKESVFKTKPLKETFRMWVFAVHTGSWAGWFGKLIYALAALIGASLPITGYILWWKKRRITKKRR